MSPSDERSTLPPLTPEEQAHSVTVQALLRSRIVQEGGWMAFDRFMDLALYAPGLGYYSAGGTKLGVGGDFVTAPELSDLFSHCVARQVEEILERTGGSILELGAGSARMAAVVLETLAQRDALPDHYFILEVSADLRDRQQQRIKRLPSALQERVVWLDRLPEQSLNGVILANEVLDALPCKRFVKLATQVAESGITLDEDGRFVQSDRPADAALTSEVAAIEATLPQGLMEGYHSELCPRVLPWIAGIAQCLQRGAMLLFDYGLPRAHYYHPQRHGGTLRCHFKQRAHSDPLINIGMQDITAWVDFTRVAEAADAAHLEVSGFTTQAAFLLGTGIQDMMTGADTQAQVRLAGEARQLMMPGEMGEIFKVIALTRALDGPLSGLAVQDLRHLL